MSASWFYGVNMNLIWILESKLIRSNNQSRANLWVLETCLIVGLLPFMIILITASLSSKMYNKASLREEFTFEEIKSTCCLDYQSFHEFSFALEICSGLFELDYSDTCFREEPATIRSHKSSAVIPSNLNPASKEMISDSVELCESEVCFLRTTN